MVSGSTNPSRSVSRRNSARQGAADICSGVSPKIGSTGNPAAWPTRSASSLERIISRRISGMAAASSIGRPSIAVVTRVPELLTSFIHLAARISSVISTAPEWRRSEATSSSRPRVLSWKLPTANQERSGGELRSTIPGSHIIDEISMTQPRVRCGPTTSAIVSAVMPFCTPTSKPSGCR